MHNSVTHYDKNARDVPWAPSSWTSEDKKREFQTWLDACRASLCSRNWRPKGSGVGIEGVEEHAECDHQWCQAIVDVMNRRLFEHF